MTDRLEPRQVDRPFVGRWVWATTELILRCPLRFGAVVAALVGTDNAIIHLATGWRVERFWVDRLGDLMLAALWTLVSALARDADTPGVARETLWVFTRARTWVAATGSALIIIGIDMVLRPLLHSAFPEHSAAAADYLHHAGDLVESVSRDAYLFTIAFGLCYFPLVARTAGVSPLHSRLLSMQASKMNGALLIWVLAGIIVLVTDVLRLGGACLRFGQCLVSGFHGSVQLRRLSGYLRASIRQASSSR